MLVVVDTNVPCVASGHAAQADPECVNACIQALYKITQSGGLALDEGGVILQQYISTLGRAGRPGAGEAFVKWACDNQYLGRCARVPITPCQPTDWREFEEFPDDKALATFDRDEHKFVAVALACKPIARILNAVDSDWWLARIALRKHGVRVEQLCPENMKGRHEDSESQGP